MEIVIKAAQLILSLSILVVLHELGHFVPAKLFKTKVEKFYLFFDPWFSLIKFKKGDTEYGIGWLPLGGYVKIAGMIDESMDKEQMAKEPQPWEFRSKPAWQRLIIMVGGVTVNLILAFIIYSAVLFTWGEDKLAFKEMKYGIAPTAYAESLGFNFGDQIVSVERRDGKEFGNYFEGLNLGVLLDDIKSITIARNGVESTIAIPDTAGQALIDRGSKSFIEFDFPFIVAGFDTTRNADQVLQKKDILLGVAGQKPMSFYEIKKYCKDHKGSIIELQISRAGEMLTVPVELDSNGYIGISPYGGLSKMFQFDHVDYGFFESIPAGINFGLEKLRGYVISMKFLFSKSGAQQMGGFGAIGNMFPSTWNWQAFWSLTAFLSIILAFMNILPIPALDGGHVMFLIYEMIVGKAPGDKFLERAQTVGMILLLALLLYANGNDIYKLIFNK